jgi:hypothetical protein
VRACGTPDVTVSSWAKEDWPVKRLVLIIPLILVLSGCTHYYVHPTKKSTAAFDKDKSDCEKTADREAAKRGTKPCDEIERCLIGKGWKRG